MKLELEIDVGEEKKALALSEALAGGRPKRSTVDVRARGSKLMINVQAEDAVAMRSVVNGYLRLLEACLKITEG